MKVYGEVKVGGVSDAIPKYRKVNWEQKFNLRCRGRRVALNIPHQHIAIALILMKFKFTINYISSWAPQGGSKADTQSFTMSFVFFSNKTWWRFNQRHWNLNTRGKHHNIGSVRRGLILQCMTCCIRASFLEDLSSWFEKNRPEKLM